MLRMIPALTLTMILPTLPGLSFAGSPPPGRQLLKLRAEIRKQFGTKIPVPPAPENNLPTRDKIRLGEALFFDPNLSGCGEVACATCHVPEQGFGDGLAVSKGCNGAEGRRNSGTVYHNAYLSHLFWDGRVQTLEQQALGPIADPAEMANTWDHVLTYLQTGVHPVTKKEFPQARKFYASFFQKVFDGEITTTTVTRAIAAYERTANSRNAPFDKWLRGDNRALTAPQKQGLLVFFGRGKCSVCHPPPHFTNSDFHNIGVPNAGYEKAVQFPHNQGICGDIPADADPGRAEVEFLRTSCADLGKFKTPTLRNVELSGPYMHNGKFDDLQEAVAHYEELAEGTIQPVAGALDPDVRKGSFQFGDGGGQAGDIDNMVEFLKALTGTQLRSPKGGVAPPTTK